MAKKKVILSIDRKVYSEFQRYCEENAIMLSKKIEIFIKEFLKNKERKLSVVLFVTIMFFVNSVYSVDLFYDGFESGNLNGWITQSAPGASNWTVSSGNAFQGTYSAISVPMSTSEPASVLERSISTVGKQNITFSYYRKLLGLDAADEFKVKWFDGVNWYVLEETGSNSANDANYVFKSFSLPSSANNNPNFRIRFECTAGAISESCQIDNVNISGGIIDYSPPSITIVYPLNNVKYNYNVSRINYTLSEFGGYCWYSNSSGQWNSSGVVAGQNFTNLVSVEGWNNWRVYCNDSIGNLNYSDVSFFKDTIFPKFSNYVEAPVNGSNYSSGQVYRFNVTITEANINSVGIEFNGVNYSGVYVGNISNVYMFNISDLAAGVYSYYWWANDSVGNFNKSETRNYSVQKATPLLTFLANGGTSNLTLEYPQQVNISAVASGGTVGLDKDGVDYLLYNGLKVTLGAGSYIFRVNITGNQNYSNVDYSYYNVTITKNLSVCEVLFNASSPQNYPYKFKVYGNCTSAFYITRNGIIVGNNSEQDLGAGEYNFVVYRNDTQNYTNTIDSKYFLINKGTVVVDFLLNGVFDNLTISYGSYVNASARASAGTVNIYRNNISVNSENHQKVFLGAGYYQYIANSTGNENYSSGGDVILYANFTKANPNLSMSISITPSLNVNYGTQTSASASETNTGDSDLNYDLFRNGVNVANPNTEVLNAGTYIYEYNTTGGENYTSGSISKTLVVNKLSNPVSLFLNGQKNNLTIEYPQAVNASGSSGSGVISLYRDGIDVTSENNQNKVLASGHYEYFLNSSGNLNYLQNSTGEKIYVNITKALSYVFVYLNYSHNNVSISSGDSVLINALRDEGEGDIFVYINNSLVYSGEPPFINDTVFSVLGLYNITIIYEATQNYTSSWDTLFVNVVDDKGPSIYLVSPEEKTYGQKNISLNYSVSDVSGVSSCWYNINNGNNITLENCSNYSFVLDDGDYSIDLYANDSLGNINSVNRNFSVSTTIAVSLTSPENNKWINYHNVEFKYSVFSVSDIRNCSLWSNFSGFWEMNQTNSSYVNSSGGVNSFFANVSDGSYIWNVLCLTDLYSKFAFSNYTLHVDSVKPEVFVSYPTNNSLFKRNVSVFMNLTVQDSNLGSCKYSFDDGKTNKSFDCSNGNNSLSFDYKSGNYNLTVYANDSAGNVGFYKIYNLTLVYDSISPEVNLIQPSGIRTNKIDIPLWFSVSDNVDSIEELLCWFNVSYKTTGGLVSGLENVSIFGCLNTTFNVPIESEYVLFLSVKDKTGNIKVSSSNFTVSYSQGSSGGGGGGGGSGSFAGGPINRNLAELTISNVGSVVANSGDKKSLILPVKNTGKVFLNNCKLVTRDDSRGWFYSKQNQGISPGENINFVFELNIPEKVNPGNYLLNLEVRCDETNKSSVLELVIPESFLPIRIKGIKQEGNKVGVAYSYNASGGKERSIDIWFVDEFGVEVKRVKDSFFGGGLIDREVSIEFPSRLVGIYSVYLADSSDLSNYAKESVVFGKTSGTGLLTILDQPRNKMIAYIIFLLIIGIGIFFIILSDLKKKKKEY